MDRKNISCAKANANIAIIKYWGKKDEKLKIPFNNSISFTLDAFYTITKIENSSEDEFYINDTKQDEQEKTKIFNFVKNFRNDFNQKIKISSYNSMPTAAGLSSSSSGFAALTLALNKHFNTNKNIDELSRISRLGSGSSSRSFHTPFCLWKSDDDINSIGTKVDSNLDLSMIIVIVNDKKKEISSNQGMKMCVDSSSIFEKWYTQANIDSLKMISYLKNNDFTNVGKLMESNTNLMHRTTLFCETPFSYLTYKTYKVIDLIKQIRKSGLECYYTMDAGPNVKILCKKEDSYQIYEILSKTYPKDRLILSNCGKGFEVWSE